MNVKYQRKRAYRGLTCIIDRILSGYYAALRPHKLDEMLGTRCGPPDKELLKWYKDSYDFMHWFRDQVVAGRIV